MRIQQFLEHHGLSANPFADEDAQTDLVFKGYCIKQTYHPAWDKIYGNPLEPATAIVFGAKGSGKTALRLQIARHLADHNADFPRQRVFVIQYDDFNPYLDHLRERFRGRKRRVERVLSEWRLWDHVDALLALGVTQLVDRALKVPRTDHAAACDIQPVEPAALDQHEARDFLLLAACYDQSMAQAGTDRWAKLRRKLGLPVWPTYIPLVLGIVLSLVIAGLIVWQGWWGYLATPWPYLAWAASWGPWLWQQAKGWWRARRILRHARCLNHDGKRLRRVLVRLGDRHLSGQPMPVAQRTDDRYEMLAKLQAILGEMGFSGIVVLVDRVDEPYLITGSAELMRALVWPLLDNKLLKHPGLGLKLLLPDELLRFVDREDASFHQRARLDKQNLVRSLDWTGESLYDLANARLAACTVAGREPARLDDLFDEAVYPQRLLEAIRGLKVPRHLFKLLYRLLVAHTNAHTDAQPVYRVSAATFESVLALYHRDHEAFDRGTGAL